MAADPKKSEGARMERRSFRDYLRRRIKVANQNAELLSALRFVETRQKRYDKKPLGLGK